MSTGSFLMSSRDVSTGGAVSVAAMVNVFYVEKGIEGKLRALVRLELASTLTPDRGHRSEFGSVPSGVPKLVAECQGYSSGGAWRARGGFMESP